MPPVKIKTKGQITIPKSGRKANARSSATAGKDEVRDLLKRPRNCLLTWTSSAHELQDGENL